MIWLALNPPCCSFARYLVGKMVSQAAHLLITIRTAGLVPRYPLQKPPSRGLEGSGGEGGGGGRRSEGRRGLQPSRKASRGLQGGASALKGGFEGA